MGLDVRAYNNVKHVELDTSDWNDEQWDDFYDNSDVYRAFAYKGFEASTRGLVNHDVETDNLISGGEIAFGYYDVSDNTADIHIHHSYGGYSAYRELLAAVSDLTPTRVWSDPDKYKDIPFYEQIHFADNEGTIGSLAARDLVADYIAFREEFKSVGGVDEWTLAKYDEWTDAFAVASDNGLVDFH